MSLSPTTLLSEVRKYSDYRRTVRELSKTAMSTRFDFDLNEGDFDKMARNAVYGA